MIIFVSTNKRGKLIMNTIENNKLIAEFMGYANKRPLTDSLLEKLYNDWNSIMPVVEKIRVIDQTAKGDFRTKLLHYQRNNKNIFDASILEGIQFVYTLVVEFIK